MLSKRGQGLSTNAIVLIILAVVVLAVLVIGFTMGWKTFAPWLSSSNVDTIVQQCNLACDTNSIDSFCNLKREVKGASFGDGDFTCQELMGVDIGVKSCDICPGESGKDYVWMGSLKECIDAGGKSVPTVDQSSLCKGEKPTSGMCCEQDK